MTVYARMAESADGQRRLARARLKYRVLTGLHSALESSGITKTELATRLGIRKSAVSQVFLGDGNLQVGTIADYFDSMGCEVEFHVVPKGKARMNVAGHIPQLALVWEQAQPMPEFTANGNLRPETVRALRGAILNAS